MSDVEGSENKSNVAGRELKRAVVLQEAGRCRFVRAYMVF
jgi:hypothetical protein